MGASRQKQNDFHVSPSVSSSAPLIYLNSSLHQFVWEPVPGQDASVGQHLAAGSHHPLPLTPLSHPLCGATPSKYSPYWPQLHTLSASHTDSVHVCIIVILSDSLCQCAGEIRMWAADETYGNLVALNGTENKGHVGHTAAPQQFSKPQLVNTKRDVSMRH